jgi:hypothetical protein
MSVLKWFYDTSTDAATGAEDVNGGLLGVLAVGPITATTKAEDVDGGPPEGCWWQGR